VGQGLPRHQGTDLRLHQPAPLGVLPNLVSKAFEVACGLDCHSLFVSCLSGDLRKMLVVKVVGHRHHPLVPAIPLARLVPTDQQDRGSAGIECEEDSGGSIGLSSFIVW
jgi:hypothetical protein